MLFAAILCFPGNVSQNSSQSCFHDHKDLWEFAGHFSYDIWSKSEVCEIRAKTWGDNTRGIWNVLCKTSSSNFWPQRAFCSSANKYLWAAFSDSSQNSSALVCEVRKILISCSSSRPLSKLILVCLGSAWQFLHFDHAFLTFLDEIEMKRIEFYRAVATMSSKNE